MEQSEVVEKLIHEIAIKNKAIISADDPIMVIVTALNFYSTMLKNGNDDLLQKNAEIFLKNLSEFEGSLTEFTNRIITEISNSVTDQISGGDFQNSISKLVNDAITKKMETFTYTVDLNVEKLNEVSEKQFDKSSATFSSYERNFNRKIDYLQKIIYMLFGVSILVMISCLVVTFGVLM